jgi:DNA polymerase-3 subunit delta'
MSKECFTIGSVLGQEKAKGLLRRAVKGGRLAHAYLLRGPAGVGKKSLALAFGNYLNCLNPLPEADACGQCVSCRKLASGNHPDRLLIEPDGATIKIGQVRELKRALTFPPLEATYRVVIITEVQSMRREAANSLLKLLEEPPPGNLLFLTGDTAGEILPTILSRCQQIPLSPLPLELVSRELIGDSIPPTTAATLAGLADGSLGRARTLAGLEFLELRREVIGRLLTTRPNRPESAETVFSLAERTAALSELLPEFLGLLRLWFRDLLLMQHHQPQRIINRDLGELLEQGPGRWPPSRVTEAFKLLARAEQQLTRNCNRTLVCEVLYFALL